MEKIHIGQQIKDRLDVRGMTPTVFARRLKRTSQSLYHIFNSASIDTELLQQIGEVLEYDFFSLYSSGKQNHGETKNPGKKNLSILINIEDPTQQKAILKIAGITMK